VAQYRISVITGFNEPKDIEWTVKTVADIGYQWVEVVTHTGWHGGVEVGYNPSWSMEEDPLLLREICEAAGVKVSAIHGHSPFMKPEAAVPRLTHAIELASANDCRIVNSDEMIKPKWMDDDWAHEVMRYTLKKASLVAARHGVYVCVEPHGIYTKTTEGLLRIVQLVDSPWMAVNWDTGNSYLAGIEDPYQGLERVRDWVRNVHAKDISTEHSERERGKVTGTPVGCAVGEGLVDWERVLSILDPLDRQIGLSVEVATVEEAERSFGFLTRLLGKRVAA
jgi:sugar phosphate isomerase/epimerase